MKDLVCIDLRLLMYILSFIHIFFFNCWSDKLSRNSPIPSFISAKYESQEMRRLLELNNGTDSVILLYFINFN